MEYFAVTKKLARILNDPRMMLKYYGKSRAKRIQARLDELDAAQNLTQIPSDPPPRCHLLQGKLEGKFAVDVSGNYRMVFEGYDKHDQLSTIKEEIVTIQIMGIEDYH
ncbi:type II toxin-antitoxin system RelE/ParE family toxin [uncultured Limosilactobacillus sp.]|uniref:type II toxin-antitoxin system RelE/ParE family toxin n=1 Tax=uncultured Limosilactobacillus sp. TaxID=2837629 RepID=UPI0026008951|nr:type II toxin-antitoxin system RelE/ParE family toxin [uncultured Limosilactobacillus sp.]